MGNYARVLGGSVKARVPSGDDRRPVCAWQWPASAASRARAAAHRWHAVAQTKQREPLGKANGARMQLLRAQPQNKRQHTNSVAGCVCAALAEGGRWAPPCPFGHVLSLANGVAGLCTACLAAANWRLHHLRGRNSSVSANSNTSGEHRQRPRVLIPSSCLGPRQPLAARHTTLCQICRPRCSAHRQPAPRIEHHRARPPTPGRCAARGARDHVRSPQSAEMRQDCNNQRGSSHTTLPVRLHAMQPAPPASTPRHRGRLARALVAQYIALHLLQLDVRTARLDRLAAAASTCYYCVRVCARVGLPITLSPLGRIAGGRATWNMPSVSTLR